MKACVLLAFVTGCGFSVGASTVDSSVGGDVIDSSIDTPGDQTTDAPPSVFGDIDLIPPSEERAGTGSWTVGAVIINTSTLMSSVPLPNGVTFTSGPQDNGPEVAYLRAVDFKVTNNQVMRVLGTRPLVIICEHDCDVDGIIDISARLGVPGAGGKGPAIGDGKGGDGLHNVNNDDGGGGGGGFGSMGAAGGGTALAAGGGGGTTYALMGLAGGSGGGGAALAAGCTNVGGGGGGAILIYAKHKLSVAGAIDAGGGGGERGGICAASNYGPGAGGGAGGVIYLQTPDLKGAGIAVTNGGGGGGGACSITLTDPTDGDNAQTSMTLAARGGFGSDCGTAGGKGAIGTMAAAASAMTTTNGGGGGGGVGRVVFHAPGTIAIQASPPAVIIP